MALVPRILQTWRAPGAAVRGMAGLSEPALLALLLGTMAVYFVAQWPGHARAAVLDPSVPLQARLGGALLAFGGHKGTAIALMVELLCAALVCGQFSFEVDWSAYPGAQTPRTGQTASIPRSASQLSLPSAAWARQSATDVADGGSSERWKPATQRVQTSIASVSQGRWIGARVSMPLSPGSIGARVSTPLSTGLTACSIGARTERLK